MLDRVNRLRVFLQEQSLDAAFITSGENVFYLSGFTGFGDARLFITEEAAVLLTDARYALQAEQEAPLFTPIIKSAVHLPAFRELVEKHGIRSIAFENQKILYSDYIRYTEFVPGLRWAGLDHTIEQIRNQKDIGEQQRIREACRIAADAFNETLPYLRAGITEQDVACELEYRMRRRGAAKPSFDTIVASGKRGAMPHGTASGKKLEKGDGITMDFGAVYCGYCSDMTRTVFLEEPAQELRRIYEIVLEAQLCAINGFYEGIAANLLDQTARNIIASNGYGACFGHGLGHGVGVEIHEGVNISARSQQPLTEGMVFSIEPGIYVPDLGGVRIEDLVTVSGGALQILTADAAKDILIL